jgi:hypothetical protein
MTDEETNKLSRDGSKGFLPRTIMFPFDLLMHAKKVAEQVGTNVNTLVVESLRMNLERIEKRNKAA